MILSLQRFALTILGTGALLLALGPARSQSHVAAPAPEALSAEGLGAGVGCADALRDAANPSFCMRASSSPALGNLYPLSEDLFVQPGTGFVGIGTTFPFRPLEVVGGLGVSSPAGVFKVVARPSTNGQFGVLETITSPSGAGFPQVTGLLSTVSIDPASGAMATFRGTSLLAALTTPANDSNSGFVSVRNANVEIAGINGGTGIVFGTAKAFVQPHPEDPTKEIQYVGLEGPENGVYFRGTATLFGGEATLRSPESFRLVARAEGLTVTLTPLGPSRGLYVERKGLETIVVRENEGGKGDVSFDYLVMGVRSALPDHVAILENTHFAPRPGGSVPEGALPGAYRELMIQSGILQADGSVDEACASALGWRLENGAWIDGKSASAAVAEEGGPR